MAASGQIYSERGFPKREPARKAATLLANRMGLTPPVDIKSVVEEFATVSAENWPGTAVDGLTVRRPGVKPQIAYRSSQPPRRARFTLAHELGHILIPWHLATTTQCSVSLSTGRSTAEQEADAFAAALMMPPTWVADLIFSHNLGMSDVIGRLALADISAHASIIALARALPEGWAFEVDAALVTSGYIGAYSRGELASTGSAGEAELHSKLVKWWRLFDSRDFTPGVSSESARPLLVEAIDATKANLSVQQIEGKVSGLIGSPKAKALQHPSDQFAYVVWRFETEGHLLAGHDGFKAWLSALVEARHRRKNR